MTFLLHHVVRSLWKIKFRFLAICMICASAFGMLVGAYSSIDSLFNTVDEIQTSSHMADMELLIAADDAKNLPDFSALPEIVDVTRRTILPAALQLDQQQSVSALLVAADPEAFARSNRLHLLAGNSLDLHRQNDVLLERNCAAYYRKSINDRITLKYGYESYQFSVSGIVLSPEYLVAPLNPGIYVPTNGSLCVVYVSSRFLQDRFGFDVTNSLLLHFHPKVDPAAAMRSVLDLAETRLNVDYALSRQEQFSMKFLELDLNTFKVFLPAVVAIFTLSSVLVIFFLMYQWIKQERTLIAMMLTLGYSRLRVFGAYAMPAVAIIVIAIVMGFGIALFDMWGFGINYANAIGMPPPALAIQPIYIAYGVMLVVISVVVGMCFPLLAVTRISPIDGLRQIDAVTDGTSALKRWLLRKLRGPFWFVYSVRNTIRTASVSSISMLAVSVSLAVTISFYISLTSMERTAIRSVERDAWSAVVDLDAPIWEDEIDRFKRAAPDATWSMFVKGGAQIVSTARVDSAYLVGIDPASGVRNVTLIAGRDLHAGDVNSVVLERRLAANHSAEIGSVITLKVRGEIYHATVVGILSGAVPGEVIAPKIFAQRMLSLEEQATGLFVLSDLPPAQLVNKLFQVAGVIQATSKVDIIAAILSISSHIWKIIHLSALVSIGVSVLFILTSLNFAIVGRRGEFGLLRIIGYNDKTVIKIVLCEVLIITSLAALTAIPMGYGLGLVLNDRLTNVWFKVITEPSVWDYLRVLLPAIVMIPLAGLPPIRAVFRIHPVDIIKERKFG